MKKVLFSLVLVAMLVSLVSVSAMAQDTKATVPASVRENVISTGVAPVLKQGWSKVQPPAHPPYCNGNGGSCLFYAGDFNSSNSLANGLANETDIIVPAGGTTPNYGAAVYANFQVPAGFTWNVTGLLSNVLSTIGGIDPTTAYWEIDSANGSSVGSVLCSGTATDSFIATGRNGFGLNEYTVKVNISGCPALTPANYFSIVIPACTGSNGSCPSARYFLSDVTDKPPANKLGYTQPNEAYFTSNFFGVSFEPTWGSSGLRRPGLQPVLHWRVRNPVTRAHSFVL